MRDFYEICSVCSSFRPRHALAVKIWMDLPKWLRSYEGFKFKGPVFPKSSAPPSGKTIRRSPDYVLDVSERARGPLSPCQDWWGSDFTAANQKRLSFYRQQCAQHKARRYLSCSEADFEVFRPAGVTCCTDGMKFGTPPPCQISPPSVQQ